MNDKGADEILEFLLFNVNAPLEDEVNSILAQEFGNSRGLYYSIPKAIAQGKNTLSSTAGSLNISPTSITRQVKELKDYSELIEGERPYEGKRGIYRIVHPLMECWFSEIHSHYSDYIARRPDFIDKLRSNLNTYYGRAFERIAREFLIEKLNLIEAKRQWGKIKGAERGEDTYEIGLIGKGKREKTVFEFKWTGLTAAATERILYKLRQELAYMRNPPNDAKLGVVARKIDDKEFLRDAGFVVHDMEDF